MDFFCSDCLMENNHKQPFSPGISKSLTSLQLIPLFFPLKSKSEVYYTFVAFKCYVENNIGNKIKSFRSDSEGEFTSNLFQSFLKINGILHQFSGPHTLEQNGCVEKKHSHLVETAKTLLVASKVPHDYLVEAFSTAIYLINRLPIFLLLKSP